MAVAASSIRLSERARRLKPSATLEVSARVRALVAEGRDVIGFGAGEPDFDTPEVIKQAAVDALAAGRTRYEPIPGPLEAREAVAEKLRRENGIPCDAGDVVISVGAKHALFLALQAVVDPGREVVVPTPAWVSYRPMIELCGGVAVEVPGSIENDFKATAEQIEAAIGPATVAVLLNSPSNPCGTMYAPAEIEAIADVVARHDHVTVVSDEIYERLVFGDVAHLSPGSLPAIADRVITINGLSKAYAMTGWRLGYSCAPGSAAAEGGGVARAVTKLQGQMTSHATSFAYPALVAALREGDTEVERMRDIFGRRARIMHGLLSDMPGIRCPRPSGAFYVFPDVGAFFGRTTPAGRRITSALTFAEALLEEAHVAVVPGEDFGAGGERQVRLGFACSEDTIREGCRRMATWLATL